MMDYFFYDANGIFGYKIKEKEEYVLSFDNGQFIGIFDSKLDANNMIFEILKGSMK